MPHKAWGAKRERRYEHIKQGLQRRVPRSDSGPGGRTYRQLYEEAKDRNVDGRSKMSKAQLERALAKRR